MQKCTGLYNYGVRVFKLKLILGVLISSLFISSCSSGPINSITGSGEIEDIKLSESGTKLQKSIDNVEDMCTLFTNLSEYVYWSSRIGKGNISSQEETKIKKYIISLELISSLDRNYKPGLNESLQDLWPTINDGYPPALDKITSLIEIFHPGCVYSEIVKSDSVAESQPDLKVDEEITPDPVTGVDISTLPSGKRNSTAYEIGVEQANAFITTGGLTRATYSDLGGLENSCKFILDTFMLLSGGGSTRQQYADFLLGCTVVLKEWY